MAKTLQQISTQNKSQLEAKQNKTKYFSAIIGHPDGSTVYVTDKSGYVWARLGDSNGKLIMLYIGSFAPSYNLPVMVYRLSWRPSDYGVVDVNVGALPTAGVDDATTTINPTTYLTGIHAPNHAPDGIDPLWVQQNQILPLMPSQTKPPGMTVYVYPGVYPFGITQNYWAGGYSSDLSAYLPSSGYGLYCLIYLDGATNTLSYVLTAEFMDNILWYPSSEILTGLYPGGSVPIAAVLLFSTTSVLYSTSSARNIYDRRMLIQPSPSSLDSSTLEGLTAGDLILASQIFGG